MKIFTSDRYFTLFDFRLSHSQLLLRSSKTDRHENNIDIIIFDVQFLEMPISFWGILIEDQTDVYIDNTQFVKYKKYIETDSSRIFSIKTKDNIFHIVASYLKIYENQLEFHETSLGVLEPKGREIELKLIG